MRSYVIKPDGRVVGLRIAPLPVPTSLLRSRPPGPDFQGYTTLRVRAILPHGLPHVGRANRKEAHRSRSSAGAS
jgi:hypothetical protein